MTVDVVYTGTRVPTEVPDGLRVRHRPLIATRPVEIDADRLAVLTTEPAGIVVYSRNAVRALEAAGADRLLGPLAEHTWWAVGDKTAGLLAETFDIEVRVPDRQNFEGLRAGLAEAELPSRVVALSLEGKCRDLASVLVDRGITFEDVPVYRTGPVDYEPPFETFRAADWLMFASPRAVAVFADLVDTHPPGPHAGGTRIAAIGPTTADALRDRGFPPDLVPPEPGLAAMMEAIAAAED
ncbi:MAG: uroporphyrinogen-III synthase [Bradymonadaceae bacterium]